MYTHVCVCVCREMAGERELGLGFVIGMKRKVKELKAPNVEQVPQTKPGVSF